MMKINANLGGANYSATSFKSESANQYTNPEVAVLKDELKATKTAALVAGAASLGSLALAGLMAVKARKITADVAPLVSELAQLKTATQDFIPLINDVTKLREGVKSFATPLVDLFNKSGLDKAGKIIGETYKNVLTFVAEKLPEYSQKLDIINKEADPKTAAKLAEEFYQGLAEQIALALKTLDGKVADNAGDFIKTPLGKILASINGKTDDNFAEISGVPEAALRIIRDLLANGKTIKNPEVKALIDANPKLTSLVAEFAEDIDKELLKIKDSKVIKIFLEYMQKEGINSRSPEVADLIASEPMLSEFLLGEVKIFQAHMLNLLIGDTKIGPRITKILEADADLKTSIEEIISRQVTAPQ